VTLFRGGAGTGKSYVLRELAAQVQQTGRPVVVLAPQRQQVVDMEAGGFPSPTSVTAFLQNRDDDERRSISRYRKAVEAAAAGRLADSFERLDKMGAVVACGLADQVDKSEGPSRGNWGQVVGSPMANWPPWRLFAPMALWNSMTGGCWMPVTANSRRATR
jgi:hypothetical protein